MDVRAFTMTLILIRNHLCCGQITNFLHILIRRPMAVENLRQQPLVRTKNHGYLSLSLTQLDPNIRRVTARRITRREDVLHLTVHRALLPNAEERWTLRKMTDSSSARLNVLTTLKEIGTRTEILNVNVNVLESVSAIAIENAIGTEIETADATTRGPPSEMVRTEVRPGEQPERALVVQPEQGFVVLVAAAILTRIPVQIAR